MMKPAVEAPRIGALARYRLRLKRRRLLWRAFRSRRALKCLVDRTAEIASDDILVFSVVRNELQRLPYFLDFYRRHGVRRFLMVDNGSDDGTCEFLAGQPDLSLWSTQASYREARFGLDWTNWLLMRFGHGHWCLTVDADELLIYADHDTRSLADLTAWLDANDRIAFGALLLDLYPEGPLDAQTYTPGDDPLNCLTGFDPGPYRGTRQAPMGNLWVQGGARDRVFFLDAPERAPTMNKLPLVRWNRRFAYVNSTHSALPPRLNRVYEGPGGADPSGVLLHTKFLPGVSRRAESEKQRGQHFHSPRDFAAYYDAMAERPTLWDASSERYRNWRQLVSLGLMNPGGFAM